MAIDHFHGKFISRKNMNSHFKHSSLEICHVCGSVDLFDFGYTKMYIWKMFNERVCKNVTFRNIFISFPKTH